MRALVGLTCLIGTVGTGCTSDWSVPNRDAAVEGGGDDAGEERPDAHEGARQDAGRLDASTLDSARDAGGARDPHASSTNPGAPGNEEAGADAFPDDGKTPPACAPGTAMGDAGSCIDIDECAANLDDCSDNPDACLNAADGTGYTCACPTGYRGTGRGADGCVDIDECKEESDSCDPLVQCMNTPGSHACGGCPAGYAPDAGGTCEDIDECQTNKGGCAPMAECSNHVGAPNTCICPSGFAGNGVGADGCRNPCVPDPCAPGLSCVPTPSGTASCQAACASSDIGCQAGDICTSDADCKTGDSNATCDARDKVCVTVCPTTTILSQANLQVAKFCREIDGDLKIEPEFPKIDASAFPYLVKVRGNLLSANPFGTPAVTSITIASLQTVDGDVNFAALTSLTELSLPRLSRAQNVAIVFIPKLTNLSFPQLSQVGGDFSLHTLQALSQLNIGRLSSIGGKVTLNALCLLPWSQAQRISTLGSTPKVSDIGCCNQSSDRVECGSSCVCN